MKNTFRLASTLVAMGLLSLASATASAGIITFDFTNSGAVGSGGSCGSNCTYVQSNGIATETGGLSGFNQWWFQGVMKFYSGWPTGHGDGLTWSFDDLLGGNDLYGSFTSDVDFTDYPIQGVVQYTVLGGSGIF